MRLYHGSPIKNLKELLAEYSDEGNFEGSALYFTDNLDIAKEYALHKGSVYTVDLSHEPLLDFTSKELLISFLKPILNSLEIDIDSLEFLDAGTNHILRHNGKNGIWSLGLDVSDILKFESGYKNRTDLKDLESKLTQSINNELNKFKLFKINDSGNQKSHIFIYHHKFIKVEKEFSLT